MIRTSLLAISLALAAGSYAHAQDTTGPARPRMAIGTNGAEQSQGSQQGQPTYGRPSPTTPAPNASRENGPAVEPITPPPAMINQTRQQIEEQGQGNYGAMVRSTGAPLGTIQRAWDNPKPEQGQASPGEVPFDWHPGMVMPIRIRIGTITDIIIPEWDKIEGQPLTANDHNLELFVRTPNSLAVRANEYGVDGSISVYGVSGNLYKFYVRVEGANSDHIPDLNVYVNAPALRRATQAMSGEHDIAFKSRTDTFSQLVQEQRGGTAQRAHSALNPNAVPDYITALQIPPEQMYFDYEILARDSEKIQFIPKHVFTDGAWTYFDFGPRSVAAPTPIFYAVIDGVETSVAVDPEGDRNQVFIVKASGYDFVLRSGQQYVCIHYTGPADGYVEPHAIATAAKSPSPFERERGTLMHNDPAPAYQPLPPQNGDTDTPWFKKLQNWVTPPQDTQPNQTPQSPNPPYAPIKG